MPSLHCKIGYDCPVLLVCLFGHFGRAAQLQVALEEFDEEDPQTLVSRAFETAGNEAFGFQFREKSSRKKRHMSHVVQCATSSDHSSKMDIKALVMIPDLCLLYVWVRKATGIIWKYSSSALYEHVPVAAWTGQPGYERE